MKPSMLVFRRRDGLYDWRLVAGNGQIVATSGSQGYTERNDAQEAVERVLQLLNDLTTTTTGTEAINITEGDTP